nr:MAG TPA: hypothetical protein [Caudoviricetes sp.]
MFFKKIKAVIKSHFYFLLSIFSWGGSSAPISSPSVVGCFR